MADLEAGGSSSSDDDGERLVVKDGVSRMQRMIEIGRSSDRVEDVVEIHGPEVEAMLRQSMMAGNFRSEDVEDGETADFDSNKDDSKLSEARTCLILPFSYTSCPTETPKALAQRHLARRLCGGTVAMWQTSELPKEADQFSSHFQKLLGVGDESIGATQRLQLTDDAITFLFEHARLWAYNSAKGLAGKACTWKGVSLVMSPNGAALSVDIDWMHNRAAELHMTLSDLRTWVYIAKYRENKLGVAGGWSFGGAKDGLDEAAGLTVMGPEMCNAVFGTDPIAFGAVANWLVKFTLQEPDVFSKTSYNFHHTCAVVQRALADDEKRRKLFYQICNMEGARSRLRRVELDDELDKVLRLRENRVVYLSPRGAFGVEWEGTRGAFVRLFVTQFRLLAIHAIVERQVLMTLSVRSVQSAQRLPPLGSLQTLEQKALVRRQLLDLSTMLMRYVVSLSTDHCGGRASLQMFFSAIRAILRIKEMKEELREEVKDTLRIVESDYLEERHVMQQRDRSEQKKRDIQEKEAEAKAAKQRDFMSVILSLAGAVLLPFTVVSGVFGMNNADLPVNASWGWLIGGTGIFSAIVFVILWITYQRTKVKPEAVAVAVNTEHEAEDDTFDSMDSYLDQLERT